MKKEKRFQIIQLYSNGDCLYATTVARQLKNDFPDCHITWIIEENCKTILRNNPHVDVIAPIVVKDKKQTEQIIAGLKEKAAALVAAGELDEFFVTHISGDNYVRYDGAVRSSILRNFPYPITVDTTPVVVLDEAEKEAARLFAEKYRLSQYSRVILYECAPLSGQLTMTDADIAALAGKLAAYPSTCVVLSSLRKIDARSSAVFDGSILSLRETAALSHYCTLLLGSSSGISWICTSGAAKSLPMVQLLDKNAYVFNPLSVDFAKRGQSTDNLIELYNFTINSIEACVKTIFDSGFAAARQQFNQPVIFTFRLFRGIIHHFLKQGKIGQVMRFIRLNLAEHGYHRAMLLMMARGIFYFPVQVILDKVNSRRK